MDSSKYLAELVLHLWGEFSYNRCVKIVYISKNRENIFNKNYTIKYLYNVHTE
jgi:hypothetical protein